MKYLLDTAAYLWFVTDNTRLSDKGRGVVKFGYGKQ